MTPKEELIQAIEHSPDDLVQALLELFKVLQRRQSQLDEVAPTPSTTSATQSKTILERMGGQPKQMLSVGGLSDRDYRRDIIARKLQEKYSRNQDA